MISKLFQFKGGIRVPHYKDISNQESVTPAKIPSRLVLPLHQHIGEAAEPCVNIGDQVLKGQKIANANGYVSAPIHAPTSGIIEDIGDYPIAHPSGMSALCIVIQPDGKDQWAELESRAKDYTSIDPSHLRNIIRRAGIVGLGGAGFPTFIKHNPGPNGSVDTLIINGSECEPYITCDDALMRERADEIVCGILIIKHALNAKRVVIAVEDNKPEAFQSIKKALDEFDEKTIEAVQIPTLYPAGSEKQLIYTITGKEVPKNSLPIHISVVCQNVGTTAAVYRAIHHGEPLISRYVTITGDIGQPKNLEVLFGTPIEELVEQCGGVKGTVRRLIVGGPMMGFAMHQLNLPVIKTTNCVLIDAESSKVFREREFAMPCIRCGSCADACPIGLVPQQLYWHSKAQEFDKAQDYHLYDCIECGCCDYVCPSKIPLVQYYRFAKAEIWKREQETQKADTARQRHEFKQFRVEREKAEKAEKHRQKKAALEAKTNAKKDDTKDGVKDDKSDPKKAAILAAMERAKAKKAEAKTKPQNTDNLTDAQKHLIEKIDARRTERRAAESKLPAGKEDERRSERREAESSRETPNKDPKE